MAEKKKLITKCQEGICPLCGGEIEYNGAKDPDDSGFTIPWQCTRCNAEGKEGYTETFDDMHYEVYDEDGNEYEIVNPATEPAPAITWAQIIAALPKTADSPDGKSSNYYWTGGEEILCRTKEMSQTVADFLDALGLKVTVGYYDPVTDKLDGCEDAMTGWYYVK